MKLQSLKFLQSIKFLIILSLIIGGCSNSVETKKVYDKYNRPLHISSGGDEYLVSEWEYKEHTYIIISRTHGGGITHAGHCKCNTNRGTGRDTLVRTLR
jgi:predicted small secreted protein